MNYRLNIESLESPEDVKKLIDAISEIAEKVDVNVVTTAPNGNTEARKGKIVLYDNSGVFQTWINTDGSKTWRQIDETVAVADEKLQGWINFDGTSGDFGTATRDSFNVSSITDNGVGDYTVTWDTDFADANYTQVHGTRQANIRQESQIAGSTNILVANSTPSAADSTYVMVIATGDQ